MSTQSSTVLDRILAETRVELERRKRALPLSQLVSAGPRPGVGATAGERRLREALMAPGMGVIAEFKRRSPSAGELRARAELSEVVSAYARGGAVAVSILTEGPNFDGSLEDLRAARAACRLPILRKDFIVDPYQLHEARAAGADAVLLIVAALGERELGALHDYARGLGLDVLVEVHDGEELARALAVGAEVIGINNRDLRDFSVDTERTVKLVDAVPSGVTVVSESGIATSAQLIALAQIGVHAVLVGELLMRSGEPESALRALRTDGDAEQGL